jgi:hypothetical protein
MEEPDDMNQDATPSPSTNCSPQCGSCQALMRLAMEVPQVSEPGHVQIFECAACGKVELRLALPAEHRQPNNGRRVK